MPPLLASLETRSDFHPGLASQELKSQWIQPSDVFSILMLLGGDVINRALAQLAGGIFTPVAFSFGWVAYGVTALVSVVGENKLMPPADCNSIVVNGTSSYYRDNDSWILGRIIRDYDYWMHEDIDKRTQKVKEEEYKELERGDQSALKPELAGLVVSFYRPKTPKEIGAKDQSFRPSVTGDLIYWSGALVAVLQLGIAAIPCGLYGDWSIMLITAIGIILAFLTGVLSQWSKEKWGCRRNADENFILTRGNGSQHAIVILGNGHGMNFEDLASGPTNVRTTASSTTRVSITVIATMWILLLITASAIQSNTWYLLAVGGVGMLQNVIVAGWPRRPEHFGIHLQFVEVIGYPRVMETLYACEDKYPRIGESLLGTFFPGELRPNEIAKWDEYKQNSKSRYKEWREKWMKQ